MEKLILILGATLLTGFFFSGTLFIIAIIFPSLIGIAMGAFVIGAIVGFYNALTRN